MTTFITSGGHQILIAIAATLLAQHLHFLAVEHEDDAHREFHDAGYGEEVMR